jgi:hypothetical protein
MLDPMREEQIMKRTAIVLGIAAAMAVAPSTALGGNTAQVESQVVRQAVETQRVSSQVVRQVVRPSLVRAQLVRSQLVKSHKLSAPRVARARALSR